MNYKECQRVEQIVNLWLEYSDNDNLIDCIAKEGTGLSQALEMLGKKKRLLDAVKSSVKRLFRKNSNDEKSEICPIHAAQTRNSPYKDGEINRAYKLRNIIISQEQRQAKAMLDEIKATARTRRDGLLRATVITTWPEHKRKYNKITGANYTQADIAFYFTMSLDVYLEYRESACQQLIEIDKRLNPELYAKSA